MADRFTLEVPGRPEHLATIRIFASTLARRFGFDEDTVADLKLAISEAGTIALLGDDESAVRVDARSVERGLDFEIATGTAAHAGDDVGGLDLIRALFEGAAPGPSGSSIVIPLRRPAGS